VEALWVFIFIVFVLLRVFSRIPDLKDKIPKDWEKTGIPPILKDMGFPWDNTAPGRTAPGKPGGASEKPAPKRRTITEKAPVAKVPGQTKLEAPATTVEFPEAPPAKVSPPDGCGEQHGLPLTDCQAVLNGIIFSELLQPPKCKRPGCRKLNV